MSATISPDVDTNVRRFESISRSFEEACRGSEHHELTFCLADQPIRLRIAGRTLAGFIAASFRHLPAYPWAAHGLSIDLWDAAEARAPDLAPEARAAVGSSWDLGDGVVAASPDGRFVSYSAGNTLLWLDRRTRHLTGCFADGRGLPLYERGKPLQMFLTLWACDRGLQPVHAALVASGSRGILLPGWSGSGKSTVALCCLDSGYTFFGDDWIALGRAPDGSHRGYGLYGAAFLDPLHAERFPRFLPQAIPPRRGREDKSLLPLSLVCPERLGHAVPVCALALPRVTDARNTSVRAASRTEALLTLTRSSIFGMRPRGGRQGLERLAELAQQIPAYWLDLGSDLQQIPRRVAEILTQAVHP